MNFHCEQGHSLNTKNKTCEDIGRTYVIKAVPKDVTETSNVILNISIIDKCLTSSYRQMFDFFIQQENFVSPSLGQADLITEDESQVYQLAKMICNF